MRRLYFFLPCLMLGSVFPIRALAQENAVDPLRLTHDVIEPTAQAISLTLDPDKDSYSGIVHIDVVVHEATKSFRIHGEGLRTGKAVLNPRSGDDLVTYDLSLESGDYGIVTVSSRESIAPGRYQLEIDFSADFRRDGMGIYKTVSQEKAYLFTQFEPRGARKSLPCWDAPEFKIPWQLTLKVPVHQQVFANSAVATETVDGEWKTVAFARTPPMPSYLIALTVGPLEAVEVPGMSVPGRVLVPAGQLDLTEIAVTQSAAILTYLEDYFGVPYPYGKLDQIAVPEYVFGAMENVGLITYLDSILLQNPKNITFNDARRMRSIIAHEMAHMWFGDLVTPQWWDDLWLNESFASWMATRTIINVFPEFRQEIASIGGIHRAMSMDALASTHAIRLSVTADINPFILIDALTYQKGQAVLEMVETWIGEDKFQAAMRHYFQRHSWGNTVADDLWQVFDEAVGGGITELASSFILQPGIPVVTFEVLSGNRLRLQQNRLSTLGSPEQEGADQQLWNIPVMFKYSLNGEVTTSRLMFSDREMITKIPGISQVDWIHPNFEQSSYYRAQLKKGTPAVPNDQIQHLSPVERLGMMDNANALLRAGHMSGADYVNNLVPFVDDPVAEVTELAISKLYGVGKSILTDDEKYLHADFLKPLLMPVFKRIGMEAIKDEPDEIGSLRATVIRILGIRCSEETVIKHASAMALETLKHPSSVDADLAPVFLQIAASIGDEKLFNEIQSAYKEASVPRIRTMFLKALGDFRDPDLQNRALAFALGEEVISTQTLTIGNSMSGHDETSQVRVVDWILKNFDILNKKVPAMRSGTFIKFASGPDRVLFDRAKTFLLHKDRTNSLVEKNAVEAEAQTLLQTELRSRERKSVMEALKEKVEAKSKLVN